MTEGDAVALRDLSQPEGAERSGHLVSAGPDWAELELTDGGEPIPGGALVRLQTSQNVYWGEAQNGEGLDHSRRLRVRVAHWLALQDISAIQKSWSQEQAD